MYSCSAHVPAAEHWRGEVAVAGEEMYSDAEHVGCAVQTRLVLYVFRACENTGAADSNSRSLAAHAVRAAQDLSEVVVAATVWYWLIEHCVRAWHTLTEDADAADEVHSVAEHTGWTEHWRLVVEVGACVSYSAV
jgi:hypothetical protein